MILSPTRYLALIGLVLVVFLMACGNHTLAEVEDVSFERGEDFVQLEVTILCWELGNTGRLTCEDPCVSAIFYRELEEEGLAENQEGGEEGNQEAGDVDNGGDGDDSDSESAYDVSPVGDGEELIDMVTKCTDVVLTKDETVTIELQSSVPIPEDEGIKLRIRTTPSWGDFYEVEDFQ